MRRAALTIAFFVFASMFPPAGARAVAVPRVDAGVRPGAGVFVHGRDGSVDGALRALRSAGAAAVQRFDAIGVVYTLPTAAQFAQLGSDTRVSYLEADRPLRLLTAQPAKVTRQDAVYARPVLDAAGRPIDGRGVGVAVVDSGVDGTHPDLAPRMAMNMKVVCSGSCSVVNPRLANTDDGGGHGTHVAGIVAGTGQASAGQYAGNARGASLYGFGTGAGLSVLTATSALMWILANHDKVNPPIRVVNNSYGSGGDGDQRYDRNSTLAKLTTALVEAGVVMVWAAGNDGGNGSSDQTTPESKNPIPGSLSVANYDDKGLGNRNGTLDSSSSRGSAADPSTWPDVTAPGANIMSTCRLTLPVCSAHLKPSRQYLNLYAELSGTSMAAPAVAGIVAQLIQADPSITPARIEQVLENTAFRFAFGAAYQAGADPTNTSTPSTFDKGHGLVDVLAALTAVCASTCSNL